jgi:hypothetical protein
MRWQGFMAAALLGVTARTARAEPPQFAWNGPECLAREADFERHLDALVSAAERSRLGGSVRVSRGATGFEVHVDIELDGQGIGTRRFIARDCTTAAETAAVASAMAAYSIDAPPKAPSMQPPAAAPKTMQPPRGLAQNEPADGKLPNPELRFGALATMQSGMLPAHVWGGALELGVGVTRRWSAAALGSVSLEQERSVGDTKRVLLRVLSGVARVCFAPYSEELVRLDTCGGAAFLWWRGEGVGFNVNRSDSLTSAAPFLAFDASLRSPAFLEWRSELEASMPLARRSFTADGERVARPAAVALTLRLGPILRF